MIPTARSPNQRWHSRPEAGWPRRGPIGATRSARIPVGQRQRRVPPGFGRALLINDTGTHVMDKTRRGNYDSGEDFVLEYGELRFTFNEEDFAERCEQAALKVGFVGGRLGEDELEDLVNLAVNGEVADPASALGEHVNDCWPELVGPAERSLVHWLRRLVFRGAWLDQRVNEGELGIAFVEETCSFAYVQPASARNGDPSRRGELIELSPEPSWDRVAYRR
jgi:hypothetical protein